MRAVKRAVDDQQAAEIVHLLPIEEIGRLPSGVIVASSGVMVASAGVIGGRSTSPVPSRA